MSATESERKPLKRKKRKQLKELHISKSLKKLFQLQKGVSEPHNTVQDATQPHRFCDSMGDVCCILHNVVRLRNSLLTL